MNPPITGPWADTNGFVFEDVLANYGVLVEDSAHPGLYRADSAMDFQYLMPDTKEDAPSGGHACTITTGAVGQLTLDLYMFELVDSDAPTMVTMQSKGIYAVHEVSDENP